MMKEQAMFIAVIPHDSGMHPCWDREVSGETRDEVLQAARVLAFPGGRYLSSIDYATSPTSSEVTTLWTRHKGWTAEAAKFLPS